MGIETDDVIVWNASIVFIMYLKCILNSQWNRKQDLPNRPPTKDLFNANDRTIVKFAQLRKPNNSGTLVLATIRYSDALSWKYARHRPKALRFLRRS